MTLVKLFQNFIQATKLKTLPRYQSLGQTDKGMYFIDCYSSKIYRLSRDWRSGHEIIAQVLDL